MSDEKSKARAEKRRQQRARQALEAFLAKLRNAGGTIEKIEQWEEYTQSLEIIFYQYEDALPIEACARLCNAIQTAHCVTEGFGDAYRIMQTKVEQVIPLLPPTTVVSLGRFDQPTNLRGKSKWQEIALLRQKHARESGR